MYVILCVRICRGQSHEIQGQGYSKTAGRGCNREQKAFGTFPCTSVGLFSLPLTLPPLLATLLRVIDGCLDHKSHFLAWVMYPSWASELPRAKGWDILCRHGYWSLSIASKEDTLITVCDQELETNPEWVWAPHKERKNDQIWAYISKVIGILTKKVIGPGFWVGGEKEAELNGGKEDGQREYLSVMPGG